jgi:hypothetical protein
MSGSTPTSSGASSVLTNKGDIVGFDTARKRIGIGSNDQVLTADSTNANGLAWKTSGSGNTFARIIKLEDETISSDSTLSNDSEILVSLSANKTYAFELILFFVTEATTDLKMTFSAPSGSDGDYNTVRNIIGGFPINNKTFGTTVVFDGTGGGSWAFVFGKVSTGETAGDLNFQWAQNASGGTNTIVKQGSSMIVWEQV